MWKYIFWILHNFTRHLFNFQSKFTQRIVDQALHIFRVVKLSRVVCPIFNADFDQLDLVVYWSDRKAIEK